ncbi:MAG: nucleoside triphosphate pyrophosphohydrolase [Alphaproteobacteria bacterium]|nr:nucleoside triphosphate pyrophosphohydrolase [Alphaproteobacteria bacterium]
MMQSDNAMQRLLDIMAKLRNPQGGCPWDLEQNFASIVPHTIEEAYEVADAIEREDMTGLKEELGDLLLQVVFHSQMANEQNLFDFEQVAETICQKLIHRHPHVFADADIKNAAQQEDSWERLKQKEKEDKRLAQSDKQSQPASILDDVTVGLPALMRAIKLQKKAAKVGFDWPTLKPVFDKVHEELDELYAELDKREHNHDRLEDELGDVLFAVCNIARHLKLDPETALRRTNRKFIHRFNYIEQAIAVKGKSLQNSTLEEMDQLWEEAKK